MRAAQEKRLIALREEWESRKRAAIERKFAIRYHKVRFFERVKLERQLNKLQRSLASAAVRNDETKSIESRIQQVKEDLEYVLHFPKGEKYVSIIKDADDPEAQEHLEKERQRLREIIRKHLAEEALVAEPDEGRGLDQINDIATEEVEGSEDDFFLNDTDDGKAEDGKALPVLAAPSQPQRGPLSMKNDDHTPARPVKKARANSHVKVPAHRNKYDAQHDRRFLASKKHVPTKSRKVMDTSAKPLSDGPTRRTRAQGGRKRRK